MLTCLMTLQLPHDITFAPVGETKSRDPSLGNMRPIFPPSTFDFPLSTGLRNSPSARRFLATPFSTNSFVFSSFRTFRTYCTDYVPSFQSLAHSLAHLHTHKHQVTSFVSWGCALLRKIPGVHTPAPTALSKPLLEANALTPVAPIATAQLCSRWRGSSRQVWPIEVLTRLT